MKSIDNNNLLWYHKSELSVTDKMEVKMNLDELLQRIVNMEYDEIKNIAQTAVVKVVPLLEKMVGKDNAFTALIVIITSCVGADGNLTPNEKRLMQDVMGVEPENARNVVQNTFDYDFANSFFDNCPDEVKQHLLLLCIAFFAVDERISKEEIDFLKRLLAVD